MSDQSWQFYLGKQPENVNFANLTLPPWWWGEGNHTMWQKITLTLNMQQIVLIVMCLFLFCLVLMVIFVLRLRHLYFQWKKRRTSSSVHTGGQGGNHSGAKRGLIGRMIARIEEFDSLTPLIVTPSSVSDVPHETHYRDDRPSCSTSSSSPPPPRRGPPGRVCLVPLCSSYRGRSIPAISPATGDFPGFELTYSTTTRSIGTIPEVDVQESDERMTNGEMTPNLPQSASGQSLTARKGPFSELDLISIDRTSVSTLEQGTIGKRERPRPTASLNGFQGGNSAYTLLPPSSKPPPVPTGISADAYHTSSSSSSGPEWNIERDAGNGNGKQTQALCHIGYKQLLRYDPSRGQNVGGGNSASNKFPRESSVDSLSSNLSSPIESSVGDSGSPLDTTGSIADLSDSFYLASESDTSDAARIGKAYYTEKQNNGNNSDKSDNELSIALEGDVPPGRRYVLHRIEEESEHDDAHLYHLGTSRTEESLSILSQDKGSIVDSECNLLLDVEQTPKVHLKRPAKEGLI